MEGTHCLYMNYTQLTSTTYMNFFIQGISNHNITYFEETFQYFVWKDIYPQNIFPQLKMYNLKA